MLRYKTETRPGLVALYDIWPGNGAGQFLQPRSPHGTVLQSTRKFATGYTNNPAQKHGAVKSRHKNANTDIQHSYLMHKGEIMQ